MDIRRLAVAVVLACLSTGGLTGCVRTRVYWTDRERVDQEISGIASNDKKTRKILVVEMTEKVSPSEDASGQEAVFKVPLSADSGNSRVDALEGRTKIIHEEKFPFAAGDAEAVSALPFVQADQEVPAPRQYRVEKDDTLQKIARKFYGTYAQWPKIYQANRVSIKDPNFLKPGTLLLIPELISQGKEAGE